MSDDWKREWQAMIEAVGQDFGDNETAYGPDLVEAGAVRRYLEPLEFDCALHYDNQVAQQYGYSDIVAPYTSLLSFTFSALWSPGDQVFVSDERNAQPVVRALRPSLPKQAPPFTGYFATDIEIDFIRAVVVGEKLGSRGRRLVACNPKETKVGRGAFITFETDVLTSENEVVARMRSIIYCYTPHASTNTEQAA